MDNCLPTDHILRYSTTSYFQTDTISSEILEVFYKNNYRKVCINARTFNSNRPLLVTAPVVLFLEYISNRTPNSSLSNIFSRFLMVSYMVILLVPLYVSKVIEVEILY